MNKDYIPPREDAFNEWQTNFGVVLTPNIAAWGIPIAAADDLTKQKAAYEKAYEVANMGKQNTRTKQQIQAKDDATVAYKASLRLFVKNYLAFNTLVEDQERLALGITVRDKVRTRSERPNSVPDLFCTTASGNRIIVTVRQQPNSDGRNRRGKPADADGFQLALSMGINPPPEAEDCTNKILYTKSPVEIISLPSEAGKTLTVYARWIGKTGQPGLWSQAIQEVVPR